MKFFSPHLWFLGLLICLWWACAVSNARAQLRIVTYNTATANTDFDAFTARPGSDTVLEAIGNENVGGIAKPIDVLLLQEQHFMATSTQSFVDVLNDIYDPINRTMYARSNINGAASADFFFEGSGGRPGLVYNTQTVELVNEVAFGTANGSNQARQTLRYQLRPAGYDSAADFFVFNNHYKAGTSSSDRDRRLIEAQGVRTSADALGEGTHIIYAGDFNVRSSFESSYAELLSAGNGQAFDPIDTPGSWNNSSNPTIKRTHTQSPASSSQFPGQVTGGVDDRFDFQLVTDEFLDDEGLSYIPGSYRAFGNNGTHGNFNQAITTGTGAAANVLAALTTASDHLPVVADYQVPAILSAQLAEIPPSIPVGASFSADLMIENAASALLAAGADELDYSFSVSGDLVGSGSGTKLALSGATTHSIMFDTSVEGLRTGTITVTTTSQGAANSTINIPVSYAVGDVNQVPFLARDDFDDPIGLNSFTQSPLPGAFSSSGDGFERFEVGVSSSIPASLVDASGNGSPIDNQGIVDEASKTDGWFGITDIVNGDNPSGMGTATWEFDIAGASNLSISIDMAAMGDFEGSSDSFEWTYAVDEGPAMALFTSSVDEAGSATYTLADGDSFLLNDPLVMNDIDGNATQLSNLFQTLSASIDEIGDTLTIQLVASTDGGSEAFAFDDIVIEGVTLVAGDDADFDQDGDVDGDDFLAWQRGLGTGTTLAEGDANRDGQVDSEDLAIWQSMYAGNALATQQSLAAVPEPNSILLLMGGLLGFVLSVSRSTKSR